MRVILPILVIYLAFCGQAQAYIMPANEVVERTEEVLRKVAGSRATFDGEVRKSEEVESKSIKTHWSLNPATEVKVTGDRGEGAMEKRACPAGRDVLTPVKKSIQECLAMILSDGKLRTFALSHGVDLNRQRLALLGSRVAHVIGSANRSLERPQIWIDQDTFQLLRIIISQNGQPIDVGLKEWAGPISKGMFPHRIEVSINGRWSRRLKLRTFRGGGD